MIISFKSQNDVNDELVELLYQNNIFAQQTGQDCEYMKEFVPSWLLTAESIQPESSLLTTNTYLLWAQVFPNRCNGSEANGVRLQGNYSEITMCDMTADMMMEACEVWGRTSNVKNLDTYNLPEYFASELNIRVGGIREIRKCVNADGPCENGVRVLLNDNFTVAYT